MPARPAAREQRPCPWLWVWAAVSAAWIAAYVSWPTGATGDAIYLSFAAACAAVAWVLAARQPTSQRRAARFIAAGVALSALGDTTWRAFTWFGREPSMSVADIGWIGAYVGVIGGLACLLAARSPSQRRLHLDALLDASSMFVVAFLVCWEFSVRNVITDETVPLHVRLVWTAYPICDSVLLAVVVRAIAGGRLRSRVGLAVGTGAICWLASDFVYLMVAEESRALLVAMDVGWLIGTTLFATSIGLNWSTVTPSAAPAGGDRSLELPAPDHGRIALVFLPLVVPSATTLVAQLRSRTFDPLPLFIATCVLVVLAFMRAALVVRSERHAQATIRRRAHHAAALAAYAADAAVVLDADHRIIGERTQLDRLMGRSGPLDGHDDFIAAIRPADVALVTALLERVATTRAELVEGEVAVDAAHGRRYVAARFTNLVDDPHVGGIVVNLHDITERKRAEAELVRLAFHDQLTGLANRGLFHDRLAHALQRRLRTAQEPIVLFVDLDGFKAVNDSLGHSAGDELLRTVAQRLIGVLRSEDTVARLGGDEFGVLIEHSEDPAGEGPATAERILAALRAPLGVSGRQIHIHASVGIVVADADSTVSSLLRDADIAMYAAKTSGAGRWKLYESRMGAAALERLQLTNDLESALDGHEFFLVYQPVVEFERDRIVGFEALVRWRHPTLGVLFPERFIGLAESVGAIGTLGRWVLDEACDTAARWRRDHQRPELSIAVNLSGWQLASPDLLDHVTTALQRSGLPPSALIVELTETVLVTDTDIAARRLAEIRRLGVRVAIDDFGTGYSSLSYLQHLPVDILKIDRSFISGLQDGELPTIVTGILDLARTLGLDTVAEGIELPSQHHQLRERRCRHGQGYLYGRPMSARDAEARLTERRPWSPPSIRPSAIPA